MPPPSGYDNGLGSALSQISSRNFSLGFEFQFAATQKTVTKRINAEIDKVLRNDTTAQKLAAFESDYRKLQDNKKLIDNFHFDIKSNSLRLGTMTTDVTDAISAFSAADPNTNLTASEVSTITAKRDALISSTSSLLLTIHPDISTPFIIRDIKNMLNTLKGMNPVAGVVDPAGTATPTNGNRAILDNLNSLSSLINTATNVTDTTLANASQISLNISASLIGTMTDMTQLSDVELAKQQNKINDIKSSYGNILRTISISYEARIANLNQMTDALDGWKIQPGSVMNLFS